MINYNIYANPKDNYISIMISDNMRIISVTNCRLRVMIIDRTEVKDTKYIEISPDRFNKLVQKAARKILCTVQ